MLYSIMTPQGVQSVMSIRDFEDIAKQYISDDYADAIRDTIREAIEEKDDAVEEAYYELNETQEYNDRLYGLCDEVANELTKLVADIRERRANPSLLSPQLSMSDIADKLDELVGKLYEG